LPAPGNFAGLFEEQNAEQFAAQEKELFEAKRRADLLERAKSFDLQALDESYAEVMLYKEVLDEFIKQSFDSQENLQQLVRHISKSKELKSNVQLANMMMTAWQNSPDNKSTAQMLHMVALSDD